MAAGTNVLLSGTTRLTGQSFSGMTVGEIRSRFASALNIPSGAVAQVNGHSVADTQRIVDGEEISFAKPLGQKGAR